MVFILIASIMLIWVGAEELKGFFKRATFILVGAYGCCIALSSIAAAASHAARSLV